MKKKLSIVLAVTLALTLLLPSVTFAGWPPVWWTEVSKVLEPMTYYNGCGTKINCNCCGPCSGVSIGRYYRERPLSVYGNNYPDLPADCNIYNHCYDPMYDALYESFPTVVCYTDPWNYSRGFIEMTQEYGGYYNFSYVNDFDVDNDDEDNDGFADDFEDIMEAIDNGWPIALCGNFKNVDEISKDGEGDWPCKKGHYIAIKGYGYKKSLIYPYPTSDHRIVCTDSYSKSNELVLGWSNVVNNGQDLRMIIIKDTVIEDFEWGNDRDSLSTSGGDVTWKVGKGGSSVAEIDTAQARPGTKSARFYRDGTNNVAAYYSLSHPSNISFYVRKASTSTGAAYIYAYIGDGTHRLYTRINSEGKLQYYDTVYHDVCSLSANTWYFIEYRLIDWDEGTYSICVNGDSRKHRARMQTTTYSKDNMWFVSFSGSGSFWIDGISWSGG